MVYHATEHEKFMIYAGQKTDTFLGDGLYHYDVYNGNPVTLLGLYSGQSTGGQIACTTGTQNFWFSSMGGQVTDLAKECDQVNVYGAKGDSLYITYVQGSTTPDQILYNTHMAEIGTTTPQVLNGFTYGEIIMGLFLFMLVLMAFFGGIINQVAGVKARARNSRNPKNV